MAKHKKSHGPIFLILLLILFGVGIYLVFYFDFYALFDRLKASRFKPDAEVVSLETELNLTDRGKDLYYALSPKIDTAEGFNRDCKNITGVESGFLLGCYLSSVGNEKIAIFNAGSDATAEQKQLFNYDFSKKVTMAHEILHGAYERRHWYQAKEIDKELSQISRQITEKCASPSPLSVEDCSIIMSDLENYTKITNSELYARLGSEIYLNKLPVNLAKDYQKYFTDTTKIVEAYAENRRQEKSIKVTLDNMKTRLDQEKTNVEYLTNRYYAYPTYNSYYAATNAINDYNEQVKEYNDFVKLYNSTFVEQLDSKTAESIQKQQY